MNLGEIGAVLRKARKDRELSQSQVAKTLGMSRATISGIENGTVGEIGVRKLIALATSLGIELSASSRRGRPTLQELPEERRAAESDT